MNKILNLNIMMNDQIILLYIKTADEQTSIDVKLIAETVRN
ncbi:hypothetical protein [Pedobacter sp. D749]|nr:hypothetical protein [Pedobacter sp. D749]